MKTRYHCHPYVIVNFILVDIMIRSERPRYRKFYTLDEAIAMLPLLRLIVGDIIESFRVYENLTSKVKKLKLSVAERSMLEVEIELVEERLDQSLEELRDMDVSFKSWDGKVDFPAWHDGREIEFCWKFGEATITHWHELYAGYANRRPITDEMTASTPPEEEVAKPRTRKAVAAQA